MISAGDFQRRLHEFLSSEGTMAASRYVDLRRVKVRTHVLDIGHGHPVVMLHGASFVGASFEPLMSMLQGSFHLLVPDRPGCGLTEPVDYQKVDFREHARYFVAELAEALDLSDLSMIGASLGGYFAIQHALSNPASVNRLVLLGPPPGIETKIPLSLRLMAMPGVGRLLLATAAKPTPRGVRAMFEQTMVVHSTSVCEAYIELLSAGQNLPGVQASWLSLLRTLVKWWHGFDRRFLITGDLPRLDVPTLMLWGEQDRVTPPSRGEAVMRTIPQLTLHIIRNAGHLVWLDAPDAVAEHIAEFLR
jgi:pimeloyl-ACP methyl ester carboxylesterase